jgi:hypothetical protein
MSCHKMSHHATPHAEHPAMLHLERSKEDVMGAYMHVRVPHTSVGVYLWGDW